MPKSGALGEIAVMKHFLREGYEVYSSVSDNSEYDMIVAKEGTLLKVEVKSTGYLRDGSYEVQLKSVRANRTGNKIKYFDNARVDFLAVYIEPEDLVIVYKASEVASRTTMKVKMESSVQGTKQP